MKTVPSRHRDWTIASAITLLTVVCFAATKDKPSGSRDVKVEVVSSSPFGVVCPWPGVSKAGIKWCRVGAGATPLTNWPEIEKEPGKFNWAAADGELKNFDDPEGLSLLPIFGYTPGWASRAPNDKDYQFYPPRDVRAFARFVGQCVNRYKDRVKVWEVWNEPNIGFFRGSVADYAEMVKAASVAAKNADPTCRIAMGCAGVDVDFLRRLYEFGCGPFFDVMSVHPYQWGAQFNDGWMLSKLEACRRLMDEFGDSEKEIWLTELGWSLSEGVTAEQQASLLVQAMVTALTVRERLKVEKAFWFCVKDWGGPGHGLFDVEGKPKLAYQAYAALTRCLEGTHYRGQWRTNEKVRAHVFDLNGSPVLAVWNSSPEGAARIEIKTQAPVITARTAANIERSVPVAHGLAALEVTHAPVFLTGVRISDFELTPPPKPDRPAQRPRQKIRRDVWYSVTPPDTTIRPYFVTGAFNALPVRIHNGGQRSARGDVTLELHVKNTAVARGRLPFEVLRGDIETVLWEVTLPPMGEWAGELASLKVRGSTVGGELASLDLPVRLCRGKAIEFLANSWTEQQYLYRAEKSGCSDSIRFGNEFGYRFDLRAVKAAELRLNVGANAANEWKVLVSNDDKEYHLERSGRSWPSWQMIALDKYLASGPTEAPSCVYVRIEGTDCQVREIVLEGATETRPAKWRAHEKSPTELVVHDARPELGMGMHGMPEEQIGLVRRLGVRLVRHTMYWGQVENTATQGKYDESQLRYWDDLVTRCERNGILLVVVVHSNPPGVGWANREESYRRFSRFMYDIAKRYPQVRYWELWNEMDIGFTDLFGAGRDDLPMRERGRLYAQMLKLAYPAIRKANPQAWVLTGGMSNCDGFPRGIYEGGGRDYFDIMNIHTYGVPIEWAFTARGMQARRIMAEFGDADKPLWNTEFGIDAGNFVGAWGYPHSWSPPQKDHEFFDSQQQREWEACLNRNRELGLYAKVLPYQFVAGNERDDDKHIKERAQLPPGMTIDDYGFGILRRDGKTPRPTYDWLLEQCVNRAIEQEPAYRVEVRCRPKARVVPVGYDYRWEGEELVIEGVKVDSAFPTQIMLKEAKAK